MNKQFLCANMSAKMHKEAINRTSSIAEKMSIFLLFWFTMMCSLVAVPQVCLLKLRWPLNKNITYMAFFLPLDFGCAPTMAGYLESCTFECWYPQNAWTSFGPAEMDTVSQLLWSDDLLTIGIPQKNFENKKGTDLGFVYLLPLHMQLSHPPLSVSAHPVVTLPSTAHLAASLVTTDCHSGPWKSWVYLCLYDLTWYFTYHCWSGSSGSIFVVLLNLFSPSLS